MFLKNRILMTVKFIFSIFQLSKFKMPLPIFIYDNKFLCFISFIYDKFFYAFMICSAFLVKSAFFIRFIASFLLIKLIIQQ